MDDGRGNNNSSKIIISSSNNNNNPQLRNELRTCSCVMLRNA